MAENDQRANKDRMSGMMDQKRNGLVNFFFLISQIQLKEKQYRDKKYNNRRK